MLRKGDIVTHFEGQSIANDGTVPYHSGERISFHYVVSAMYVHDEATVNIIRYRPSFAFYLDRIFCSIACIFKAVVTVIRDGKQLEVRYLLPNITAPYLVPVFDNRLRPEYAVI